MTMDEARALAAPLTGIRVAGRSKSPDGWRFEARFKSSVCGNKQRSAGHDLGLALALRAELVAEWSKEGEMINLDALPPRQREKLTVGSRKCKSCGHTKHITLFGSYLVRSKAGNTYAASRTICKDCRALCGRLEREAEKSDEERTCNECHLTKHVSEFTPFLAGKWMVYHPKCKSCRASLGRKGRAESRAIKSLLSKGYDERAVIEAMEKVRARSHE